MEQHPKQLNKDYINQSLVNQIANLSMQLAEREAAITELYQEIAELKKESEEKEVKEMDKGGMNNAKK